MLLKLRSNLKLPGFASRAAWLSKTGVLRALALLVLACTGCSSAIQSQVLDAQILDAQTGNPIAGAIALGKWTGRIGPCSFQSCPKLWFFPHLRRWVDFQEAETDAQGSFVLKTDLPSSLPFEIEEENIIVYKSGYIVWNNHHIYPEGEREDTDVPSQILLKPVPREYDHRNHWEFIDRVTEHALYTYNSAFPKFREAAVRDFGHEAAEILDDLPPDYWEEARVAQSLHSLAQVYQAQGRYADAERLLERSLAIWEEVLDPDDRRVAQSLHSLAQFYQARGRYAEAEPLFKRSLALYSMIPYGNPNFEEYVNRLKDYASLLRKMDRENEAAEMQAHAKVAHENNEWVKRIIRSRPLGAPWPDFPPAR